jgi:hypothetical protein
MMIVKVRFANIVVGLRKIGTALLTASTPVNAVHPLANALINNQMETVVTEFGILGGMHMGIG